MNRRGINAQCPAPHYIVRERRPLSVSPVVRTAAHKFNGGHCNNGVHVRIIGAEGVLSRSPNAARPLL